jgi:hypothetical protein
VSESVVWGGYPATGILTRFLPSAFQVNQTNLQMSCWRDIVSGIDYIPLAFNSVARKVIHMSFHEKSAWACLVGIGVVYVPYFTVVLRFPMAALGLFGLSAIALVVILVVFHTVNAIATKSIRSHGEAPPVDELDQRIELKAAKWAGFVLSIAVLSWIIIAMYSAPVIGASAAEQGKLAGNEISGLNFAIPVFSAMVAVHWLFAGFVIANMAYYGGIVLGYRRIASA